MQTAFDQIARLTEAKQQLIRVNLVFILFFRLLHYSCLRRISKINIRPSPFVKKIFSWTNSRRTSVTNPILAGPSKDKSLRKNGWPFPNTTKIGQRKKVCQATREFRELEGTLRIILVYESVRLRESIFHTMGQSSSDLESQSKASEYALRKRLHELERSLRELEWQKKQVGVRDESKICSMILLDRRRNSQQWKRYRPSREEHSRCIDPWWAFQTLSPHAVNVLDKEPLIKLAMSRQENRHSRPGMDLVRDEVSYGVSAIYPRLIEPFYSLCCSYATRSNNWKPRNALSKINWNRRSKDRSMFRSIQLVDLHFLDMPGIFFNNNCIVSKMRSPWNPIRSCSRTVRWKPDAVWIPRSLPVLKPIEIDNCSTWIPVAFVLFFSRSTRDAEDQRGEKRTQTQKSIYFFTRQLERVSAHPIWFLQ